MHEKNKLDTSIYCRDIGTITGGKRSKTTKTFFCHGMEYSIGLMKLKAVEDASSPPLPYAEQAQRSASVGARWHPPPSFSFRELYSK
jgi:hypothetical protein